MHGGESSWIRTLWSRRRGGAMHHAFLRRLCWRSFALQRGMFRLQRMIGLLTRASTVIPAVNRAGVAHVSIEMNYDAITGYNPAGSITPFLRARPHLCRFTSLPRRSFPRSAPPIHTSSLTLWDGMSGSTMRWLRRRTAQIQAPHPAARPRIPGGHRDG